MQFQSDILSSTTVRPEITETTALGAAYLAGLAVGFWKDIEEISKQWKEDKKFEPNKKTKTKELLEEWHRAVNATVYWAENK